MAQSNFDSAIDVSDNNVSLHSLHYHFPTCRSLFKLDELESCDHLVYVHCDIDDEVDQIMRDYNEDFDFDHLHSNMDEEEMIIDDDDQEVIADFGRDLISHHSRTI